MSSDKIIEVLQQKIKEQTEINNDLRRIVNESNKTIQNLSETIDKLNQTIKELTEKLGRNSRNSSKPPSSDGLNKPSPKNLRKQSGKKAGGQEGHTGVHLITMAEPDDIVHHMPSDCCGCPKRTICVKNAVTGETRQVIDANVTVGITSHKALVLDCPLYGTQKKGEFPDDIKAPVQYGENIQALVVAFNTIGAVSVNRTHEILSSVFNIPLSTGTVSNMVSRCANGLSGIVELIRQNMASSEISHCDETGTRVDGKTLWVHNASNSQYTHLSINEKRGREGMDSGGILPSFSGIAVHDCWAPYWKYTNIKHALCCAHLLRELIGVQENHPQQVWATDFMQLLLRMKTVKEKTIEDGKEQLSQYYIDKFDQCYDRIIKQAYKENPFPQTWLGEKKRGRKKKGKTLSLLERLVEYKDSICLFIKNFAVPFDNNQAERDIRMVKTKTNVSGCFRSIDGAIDYLKIMSYVGTARKHKISPYKEIRQAISGNTEFIFAV